MLYGYHGSLVQWRAESNKIICPRVKIDAAVKTPRWDFLPPRHYWYFSFLGLVLVVVECGRNTSRFLPGNHYPPLGDPSVQGDQNAPSFPRLPIPLISLLDSESLVYPPWGGKRRRLVVLSRGRFFKSSQNFFAILCHRFLENRIPPLLV